MVPLNLAAYRTRCALLAFAMAVQGMSTAAVADVRTIVGTWAPDPRECTPVGGWIAIEPRNVRGYDFRCDFSDISRIGDVVTWHGRCGFPDHARRATVVATLRGEALTIVMDGGANGRYRRCKPGGN